MLLLTFYQLCNLGKLVVMHQFFLVIQKKVVARDFFLISEQCVSDIKARNFPLLLPRAKIGVE